MTQRWCVLIALGIAAVAGVSQQLVAAAPHPPTTSAPLVAAAPALAAADTYDTKFDNVDLDEILGQQRLLGNYVRCLEGTGPCTPDARMLKEVLPDAVTTDCARCSPRQKYGAEKVTHYLIDYRPADWQRLERIYDPTGTFRRAYLAAQQPTAAVASTTTEYDGATTTTADNENDNEMTTAMTAMANDDVMVVNA